MAEILDKYKALYEENPDIIGWLTIDGTVIDYPVMQTPDDEEYYLNRGFDKQYSDNGCLIMDTDSNVGVGTKEGDYLGGSDRIILVGAGFSLKARNFVRPKIETV